MVLILISKQPTTNVMKNFRLPVLTILVITVLTPACTNLDEKGIALYKELLSECPDQLILIASNMKVEYEACERVLEMEALR